MEETSLRKFEKSVELCDEVNSKIKKMFILFIIGLIVIAIFLNGCYKGNYFNYDGDDEVMIFAGSMILIFMYIFSFCKQVLDVGAIFENLTKNKLEIKTTYLSGVYTENPKSKNNEKYFKIPYNQIEKIEVMETNIKTETFHNLMIYYNGGLIKLAVDSPLGAKDMIYGMLGKSGVVGQVWKCPKCEKEVIFGQSLCENCGQVFDWSKL